MNVAQLVSVCKVVHSTTKYICTFRWEALMRQCHSEFVDGIRGKAAISGKGFSELTKVRCPAIKRIWEHISWNISGVNIMAGHFMQLSNLANQINKGGKVKYQNKYRKWLCSATWKFQPLVLFSVNHAKSDLIWLSTEAISRWSLTERVHSSIMVALKIDARHFIALIILTPNNWFVLKEYQ